MSESFRKFAEKVSRAVGSPAVFALACITVFVWILSGPLFDFSDTWQLIINTGTTIATFLTVFLIQNTQNREAFAIHLKLDELIRANKHARRRLIDLEELSDKELKELHDEFIKIQNENEERIQQIKSLRAKKQGLPIE